MEKRSCLEVSSSFSKEGRRGLLLPSEQCQKNELHTPLSCSKSILPDFFPFFFSSHLSLPRRNYDTSFGIMAPSKSLLNQIADLEDIVVRRPEFTQAKKRLAELVTELNDKEDAKRQRKQAQPPKLEAKIADTDKPSSTRDKFGPSTKALRSEQTVDEFQQGLQNVSTEIEMLSKQHYELQMQQKKDRRQQQKDTAQILGLLRSLAKPQRQMESGVHNGNSPQTMKRIEAPLLPIDGGVGSTVVPPTHDKSIEVTQLTTDTANTRADSADTILNDQVDSSEFSNVDSHSSDVKGECCSQSIGTRPTTALEIDVDSIKGDGLTHVSSTIEDGACVTEDELE